MADQPDYTPFSPQAYVKQYYQIDDALYLKSLDILKDIFDRPDFDGKTVLDVGTGPVIGFLVSAAQRCTEIYLSDFHLDNVLYLRNWVKRSRQESLDWDKTFKHVAKLHGHEDAARDFEAKLRTAIKGLPSDVKVSWVEGGWIPRVWSDFSSNLSRWELRVYHAYWLSHQKLADQPELPKYKKSGFLSRGKRPGDVRRCDVLHDAVFHPAFNQQVDVITSTKCIEAATSTPEEYSRSISRLTKFLRPGGHLVLMVVIEETFYNVGENRFPCCYLTKDDVSKILAENGFSDMRIEDFGFQKAPDGAALRAEGTSDAAGFIIVHARKQ